MPPRARLAHLDHLGDDGILKLVSEAGIQLAKEVALGVGSHSGANRIASFEENLNNPGANETGGASNNDLGGGGRDGHTSSVDAELSRKSIVSSEPESGSKFHKTAHS